MKTLALLVGAALLLAPALACAEEPSPAPVVEAPRLVYSVLPWTPAAPMPRESRVLALTQRRSTGLLGSLLGAPTVAVGPGNATLRWSF